MNAYELADRHLRPYKRKGSEIVPMYCPFCGGGRKRDRETFALNAELKTYNCKRGKCGEKGTFRQLCNHFGEEAERMETYTPKPVAYKKPQVKTSAASSKVEEYFKTRKISKETYESYGVCEVNGAIAFPYYENGELVFMKYRTPEFPCKNWREKDGKPILWGMDKCTHDKPLVITEGEPDTLAVLESGVDNVVSVPSGAEDLTWIELCWDWLDKFKEIIIWGDNDEPGRKMQETVIKRLGTWRCKVVESPHKDANKHLAKEGGLSVRKAIKEAKEVEIVGLIRLADVAPIDYDKIEKVKSSIDGVNKILGGYMMGLTTIWTGINSSGKSTMLGQELISAVDQGYKVCAYSGELPASLFKYWINLQAAGISYLEKKFDPIKKEDVPKLIPKVTKSIDEWMRDKFFLYDSRDSVATDKDLFNVFENAVRRHGCKVFLVDNLMTTNYEGLDRDFYRSQSKFVGEIMNFAKNWGVHIHLVAHPRKAAGKLTKMDVMGSGDITNRADNVLSVHRLDAKEKQEEEYIGLDNLVQVFKNRINGVQDEEIAMKFEPFSKRFYMESDSEGYSRQYGWIGHYDNPFAEKSLDIF